MERRAARRKFGVDDLEVFDKVGAKAKPVKCKGIDEVAYEAEFKDCLLYTSPSPRDS